jgi:membrane protein implicated in regulation of membrane protease activity
MSAPLEAAVPGPLVFLFFGAGALVVALAVAVAPGLSAVAQAGLFAVTSVAFMLTLRGALRRRFARGAAGVVDGTHGETATLREAVAPGGIGSAEFRGTVWSARHAGTQTLEAGTRCRVLRIEELTLWVEPEGTTPMN